MDPLSVASSQLGELMARLTPRQLEILELRAQGCEYKQIARVLSISLTRVKQHVWKACVKTGADNRMQLIVMYSRWMECNGRNHSENQG